MHRNWASDLGHLLQLPALTGSRRPGGPASTRRTGPANRTHGHL